MLRFLAVRLGALVPVLFALSAIAFFSLAFCPGDPAELALSGLMDTESPPEEAVRELRRELGYDRPLAVQYGMWISRVLHGDMGRSVQTGKPVITEVGRALSASGELAAAAMSLTIFLVLVLGTASAARTGSILDRSVLGLSLLAITLPDFFVAVLGILFFALWLGILPVAGYGSFSHMVLPALTLTVVNSAIAIRLMRTSAVQALGSNYVLTARAKGLSEAAVLGRHVLRGALPPVMNYLGAITGHMLGGAVVVETIFMWPGVGRLLVESVRTRDVFVVQGCVLAIGMTYVVVNLVVDIVHAGLDPRVRDTEKSA
jgi:ABC-type dipeptide/oligopeptide/nickel transport system permease component